LDPITDEEAKEFREVLVNFYGPPALQWNVTLGMYEILGELIASSERCTSAMHLVPRPWDLSGPIKWAQRQVRQAIVRYLKTPTGKQYLICMLAAARNRRTEFEMASESKFAQA
jgi:hypothetical protein